MSRPDRSADIKSLAPRQGPSRSLIAAIVVVVLLIVAGVSFFINRSQQTDVNASNNNLPKGAMTGGKGILPFPGTAKANAPTVDIYEDFQCPVCNAFEKANGAQVMSMAKSGDIKLVYHMMSFLDDTFKNDGSLIAANGAFCAADAGKFEEYHKANFAGQPTTEGTGYTEAQIKSFGAQSGIKGTAVNNFNSCVMSGNYKDYVKATEAASFKNNVNGTPTFFFNGKVLDTNGADYNTLLNTPESFKQILQRQTA